MNYLSIDTEYSSFFSPDKKKSGELLQLAIIPVIHGVIRRDLAFNEFCRPLTRIWNSHAEKVHKITRTRAMTFQTPQEMSVKLMTWLKKMDDVFTCMAFNCKGDKNYLERLISDYRLGNEWYFKVKTDWYDVHTVAKKKKDMISKKKLTLESLCEYFGIITKSHDALEDAIATVEVNERLKQIKSYAEGQQDKIFNDMTEVEKKRKFAELKYVMLNGDGSVYITEYATQNKEALRIVLELIWDKYGEE